MTNETELINVFRIEGPDGNGPYHYPYVEGMGDAHQGSSTPDPRLDELEGGGGIRPNEYCGFDSMDKLIEWFTTGGDWLGEMANMGIYVVVCDTVPRSAVRKGEMQLVYDKSLLTHRERVGLTRQWVEGQHNLTGHRHAINVKSASELNEES